MEDDREALVLDGPVDALRKLSQRPAPPFGLRRELEAVHADVDSTGDSDDAAGVFSALFGVGGGIVIVPLLVAVVGLDGRRATGTSLAAIGITAAAGAVAYGLHGDLKPGAAAIIGVPAAFGAVAGVTLQQRL